ncbi:restriction endonuclease subunit S [Bradyrhizobium sp. USDA 4502]
MTERWRRATIGEVCDVVNGGTPKTGVAANWGGPHMWITPAEMGGRSDPYIAETERQLTDAGLAAANLLPVHSVILSSRAPIGHLVINTAPMATNQGCKGLVPKPDLDYKYLFYYLKSIVGLLNELGTGATFKELSGGKLKEVPIPLPPRDQQQSIVDILDETFAGLTAATVNAEKNLENARELFEAALVADVFGNADEQDWQVTTVAELALAEKGSIRTGPFGSQLLHSEFVDSGIAVLGIDNAVMNEFRWGKPRFITKKKFAQLSRYQVQPADVLITIMGTCGRCAIVPDDIPVAINTKHLCCISLDQTRCLPQFLHAYFLYHPVARTYLAEQAKGAIMAGLNMGIIQRMPVRLPPIPQQRLIIEKMDLLLQETRCLEENYKGRIKIIEELKRAIMHRGFSGKLTSSLSQAIEEAAE